ncbi:hypothetical protein ABIA90_006995 [Bradyrhizobium sp. LA6.8]
MNPNLTPVTSYVIDNVHHAHDEVCERTDLVEREGEIDQFSVGAPEDIAFDPPSMNVRNVEAALSVMKVDPAKVK